MGRVWFDGQFVHIKRGGHGTTKIPLEAVQAVSIERAGLGLKAIRFWMTFGEAYLTHLRVLQDVVSA